MMWYEQDEYQIDELENSLERGVVTLAARQRDDGSWEYAIVRWWYQTPHLVRILHNGKVTFTEDE